MSWAHEIVMRGSLHRLYNLIIEIGVAWFVEKAVINSVTIRHMSNSSH